MTRNVFVDLGIETKTETYPATIDNGLVTSGPTSGMSRFLHRILLIVHMFQ